MGIGSQLAKTLLNFLPKDHEKLNVLSGKILEIFYDEFIKFIPPFILKREEERMKQMNIDSSNQNGQLDNQIYSNNKA